MIKKYKAKLKVFNLQDYKAIAIQISINNPSLSLENEITIYEQVTSELIRRHELEYIKLTNYIVDLGGLICIDLIINIFGNQMIFKVSEDKIDQIKSHPLIENIDSIE
jgi:hypothetical protein